MLNNDKFTFGLAGEGWEVAISKPAAFTGAVANTRGDKDGTKSAFTLFTVTGDVLVRIFGVCTTDLAGAAGTVSVGVTGNTAALIALETATEIDANGIYLSATQVLGAVAFSSVPGPFLVVNGLDIIETVATTDIASGQIYYICVWRPLTEASSVVGLSE